MAELNDDANVAEKGATKGSSKMILIISVLFFLGASIAGTMFFTGMFSNKGGNADAEVSEEIEVKEPIYFAIEEPFTVNFEGKGGLRFLQISMQVMSYDPDVVEAVKTHMPAIRNNLILMLSSQTYTTLMSREGKDSVRGVALEEIRVVVKAQAGLEGVEAVYFTNFVIQ